jgi:mannan endo-1,6-alpha-mannosidase
MAPHTAGKVGTILRASATGAAAACTNTTGNITCGAKWYTGGWDGTAGVGQSLSAMEVIYALLVNETWPPRMWNEISVVKENSTLTTPSLPRTRRVRISGGR